MGTGMAIDIDDVNQCTCKSIVLQASGDGRPPACGMGHGPGMGHPPSAVFSLWERGSAPKGGAHSMVSFARVTMETPECTLCQIMHCDEEQWPTATRARIKLRREEGGASLLPSAIVDLRAYASVAAIRARVSLDVRELLLRTCGWGREVAGNDLSGFPEKAPRLPKHRYTRADFARCAGNSAIRARIGPRSGPKLFFRARTLRIRSVRARNPPWEGSEIAKT